jgi:hypothetical protein
MSHRTATPILRILPLLALSLALPSCDDEDDDSGGGGFGDCDASEVLVLNGVSYTESPIAGEPFCDPDLFVFVYDSSSEIGELTNITIRSGFDGSAYSNIVFNLNLYGPLTGTYTPGLGAPGTFGVVLDTRIDNIAAGGCLADEGTVTVTQIPAEEGDVFEASFNFTAMSGRPDCGPASGTIRGRRVNATGI